MIGLFWGLGLVLVGLLPMVGLWWSFRQARKAPEFSEEFIIVPGNDQVIRIIQPDVESRYEYRMSSVVVASDKKPDHTLDFHLFHNLGVLALYTQGRDVPPQRHHFAQQVEDWRTSMQTGPCLDFALVVVNPHPYELRARIGLAYYPTPTLLRGQKGRLLFVVAVMGVFASLFGGVMSFMALIRLGVI